MKPKAQTVAMPSKPGAGPTAVLIPSSWVEVSRGALRRNFHALQARVGPEVKVCPVIKNDAYGHGALGCASALREAGANWFAVSTVEEGVALRCGGSEERILVLSGFWPGEEEEILRRQLTPAVWDRDHLALLERAAETIGLESPLAVHLKVNTGMNRLGADMENLPALYEALRASPHLALEGVFSHFASSEVVDDPHSDEQLRQFVAAVVRTHIFCLAPSAFHMANSAAIVTRPASWFDLVRPGLAVYGYTLPLACNGGTELPPALQLQPALAWKARVLQVRDVAAGQQVGYSGGYVSRSPAKVAVLGVGYGDGLSRKLSNRGRVIVSGDYAPILGNISMNLTAVDVTAIPGVKAGDEAVIIGATASCNISAWEHAQIATTIPYEILCNISSRLPRKYVE